MLATVSTLSRLCCNLPALSLLKSHHYQHQQWLRGSCLALCSCIAGALLGGCRDHAIATPRQVMIQQSWELAPGDMIEGFVVAAGLGDISLQMNGARVRAPFAGETELSASNDRCIFFSSPEVPAYLFRYCGLRHPRLGVVEAGQTIGRSQLLHFATLRRQPEGTWVIVEPSKNVLEQSVERY
ncbi:MAG: hypothetical protein AAFX01_05300 [Cyanobacteria bacterium J06638_28]